MMYRYSVVCPHCSTWNDNLDLDETDGYYECESCGKANRMYPYNPDTLPMLISENAREMFKDWPTLADVLKEKKAV